LGRRRVHTDKLRLHNVSSCDKTIIPAPINGVSAQRVRGLCAWEWNSINLPCPFSGRLLVGGTFVEGVRHLPLGHAVFASPLEFRRLIEIECLGGYVRQISDVRDSSRSASGRTRSQCKSIARRLQEPVSKRLDGCRTCVCRTIVSLLRS
jgi:hypothetical protein